MEITDWALARLAQLKQEPRILVCDPLLLLAGADEHLHSFANAHGFTVITAATNLVFRELYEQALADPTPRKLLVMDRAPARRHAGASATQAPAPFYPDLLAVTRPEARLTLDLRAFLCTATGDPNWPEFVNEPRYARLIVPHMDEVLRAHRSLRAAHNTRFTDPDCRRIVAFAALGVGGSAFSQLDAQDYWRIGLVGHDALAAVFVLAPEVAQAVQDELGKAPAPFCWLASHDQETVIRALYLSALLAQHSPNWSLPLASADPAVAQLGHIEQKVLDEAMPRLVRLDRAQAHNDLRVAEDALSAPVLQSLLFDQWHLNTPTGFTSVLEHEHLSPMVRSLALLLALDNQLGQSAASTEHERILATLFPTTAPAEPSLADDQPPPCWLHLKEAYQLANTIHHLRAELTACIRELKVKPGPDLRFADFWELWNGKKINRLEYYVSRLKRIVESKELLPRPEAELPAYVGRVLKGLRERLRLIYHELYRQLDDLNQAFQALVAAQYPSWLAGDEAVQLTSQFIRRSLMRHWTPGKQRAVVLVFDGMRYDIWDELLRPMLTERMDVLDDAMASALLPSETHVSRWALAAGANGKEFLYPHRGEDVFLGQALGREFAYRGKVTAIAPEGSGTGETVRYRASWPDGNGQLDYYIFEMCDKELHRITMRELPDGRSEPARPLTFIYDMLKDLIDNEVMAIVRTLPPGTLVFVTADHGFGPIREQPLWFDSNDLNSDEDCSYRNCWLRVPFGEAQLSPEQKLHMIDFTPDQLGMPRSAEVRNRVSGQSQRKEFRAIVFPRVGYAFSRRGANYRPGAYSHGGISIQEMLIPMVALRMRDKETGALALQEITGPSEIVEDAELAFKLRLNPRALFGASGAEIRATCEASVTGGVESLDLPRQTIYVGPQGIEVTFLIRFDRSTATNDELRAGRMERTLIISVSYQEGRHVARKARTHHLAIQLNTERIARRVPAGLGNILGLSPKSTD